MSTRVVHCKRQPFDVLIDRSTKWGNPFIIGKHGDREDVIRLHHIMLWKPESTRLRGEIRRELTGFVLGCHCSPLACHGDNFIDVILHTCRTCYDRLEDGGICEACRKLGFSLPGEPIPSKEPKQFSLFKEMK